VPSRPPPERLRLVDPSSTSRPIVAAEAVTKRFGRRGGRVLDGVDLRLDGGSITVISGGNGSGKTTLLRVLTGLTRPSAGRVVPRPLTVGFVPDRLPSRLRMSAAQYVHHMARIRGADPATTRARTDVLFERLALRPSAEVEMSSLSKGNCQKVVLAQALLSPVALLALDEPFSALDAPARRALRELLVEARTAGAAVVLTAHRIDEIPMADRVLELGRGRITDLSRPAGITTRSEPMVTVELLSAADEPDVASLGTVAAGSMLDSSATGRWVTLVVARASVDPLLAAALDAGWSVQSVTPSDPDSDEVAP
jgi:ABC-type multidrug transport system ATPase subunit